MFREIMAIRTSQMMTSRLLICLLENQNGGKLQKQIYNDGFEGKYFEDICTDNSLVLKYFSLKTKFLGKADIQITAILKDWWLLVRFFKTFLQKTLFHRTFILEMSTLHII
jgi:hypothetical protein